MTLFFVILSMLVTFFAGFHAGYKDDEASASVVISLLAMSYCLILLAFNFNGLLR